MALLLPNATISTYAGSTAKLVGVDATIAPPSQKSLAQFGGIVRHEVLLDPATTDIQAGDDVQILTWASFAVDTTKRYRVYSAEPSGGQGLEVLRVVIGDKVQR